MKKLINVLILFSLILYADIEPNNNCSTEAETISELNNIDESKMITKYGYIHQTYDPIDTYTFNVLKTGTIKIKTIGNRTSYSLLVGKSCLNKNNLYSNIVNSSVKETSELNVVAGDKIIISVLRRYRTWMRYSLFIDYKKTDSLSSDSSFSIKKIMNLKGNLKVIGNTVLKDDDLLNTYNSNIQLKYIDIDENPETYNSSSAEINTEFTKDAKIVWAGLYTQGYLHNDPNDDGIDSKFNFSENKNIADSEIKNKINNNLFYLTLETGEKYKIKPKDVFLDREYFTDNYISYKYATFTDITNQLKNKKLNNNYTIGNLPVREGKSSSGNKYDGLGNFGAWSLVLIYENEIPEEKTRNVTIFNGYEVLNSYYNPETTIELKGFKTPEYAPEGVDSTISIFAGEGDRIILGDYAEIINQDNQVYRLPNTEGSGSYFASVIEDVENRVPYIINNNGIDIHTTKIGTSEGLDKPIKENQTKAYLRLGSSGDTYMPSMIAFSTELYTPKLCYDYDIRLGDSQKLLSEDRNIETSSYGKDLMIKTLIRSEVSDFDLKNVKFKISFDTESETNKLEYKNNSSLVSPPFINTYLPVVDLEDNKIAIGNLSPDTKIGIIKALESTYTKQYFNFEKESFKGSFNIELEGDIKFDEISEPIHYKLSTKSDTLKKCNINKVYDPIWGIFNIERTDSNPFQSDDIRYPLYTQIAGKPFDIAVTRYMYNPMTGKHDVPFPTNTTVELEIIDASLFDNNASAGYDSSCEEPDKIGDSAFIHMGTIGGMPFPKKIVHIPADIPNFDNTKAYKNLAFRVWYLGLFDLNGGFSVVDHMCELSGTCFKDLYKNKIKAKDLNKACESDCLTSYNAESCYSCLKINFAKPVCSRDNFSIRPDSFKVELDDNKEGTSNDMKIIDNTSNDLIKLSSEYDYKIKAFATQYLSENKAGSYYNNKYKKEKLEREDENKEYIILKSKNKETCLDKNQYTYDYNFIDSEIYKNNKFSHTNVGLYDFYIKDNTWTEVDQADYIYKNEFNGKKTNDCILNSGTNIENDKKIGCEIKSDTNDFKKINIDFKPYSFSFNETTLETIPNNKENLLMVDFKNHYYDLNPVKNGTVLKGKIAAVGKKETILTNFTEKCYSDNLNIKVNRKTYPVKEEEIVSKKGFFTEKNVFFEQFLKDKTLLIGKNKEVIVDRSSFKEIDPGKTEVEIYYSFTKPVNAVVNPIKLKIEDIEAYNKNLISFTNQKDDYYTKGLFDTNKTINYFFGKVTPFKKLYSPIKESNIKTPVFVDIYCDNNEGNLSCEDFGLTEYSKGVDENKLVWYINKFLNQSELDTFDVDIKTVLGIDASPKIESTDVESKTNIPFNDQDASQQDVQIKLLKEDRPTIVRITIKPKPSLLYDENDLKGYPYYKINFIGDTVWTGVGKTGMTVDSKANQVPNRKMHW